MKQPRTILWAMLVVGLMAIASHVHSGPREYVIGDSIACGLIAAGNLPGVCRVGASPAEVERMAQSVPDSLIAHRTVILSGGMSNNPTQWGPWMDTRTYLEDHGAHVVVIGVGTGIGTYAEINLRAAVGGWPGVHPNYPWLLKKLRKHE